MLADPSNSSGVKFLPHRQLEQVAVQSPAPLFVALDVLSVVVGLVALFEHFRARAAYSTAPLHGLILPALVCLISGRYRRRMRAGFHHQWSKIEAYSAGVGRAPWLAVLVFAAVPAWLLDLSNERTLGAIDTRPVVPTAISLVTEGNWELGEYYEPGRREVSLRSKDGQIPLCFQARPHGIYSSYPAGMLPFAVFVSGLSSLCDANLDNVEVQRRLEKMTAAVVAACSIGLFFLIALRLAPPSPAWISTAILSVGSGMFTTASMGLWQHGGIIFWSLLVLLLEFSRTNRPSRWDLAIQGFACAQLVTCRLTSIAFLVPFGLWMFARSPRRALSVVALAVVAYLPWAWAYWGTYENLFGPSTGFLSGGLWSLDLVGPLLGVLVSPGRGLLIYQPWLLLPLTLLLPSVRARLPSLSAPFAPTGWVPFCLAVICCQVLLISAWGCWWGGWCWGSRLVVEIVPMGALICVRPIAALWESRRGRALVVSLALLGVMAHVPAVYFNAFRWNATARFPEDTWSWSHPPFLDWHLGP